MPPTDFSRIISDSGVGNVRKIVSFAVVIIPLFGFSQAGPGGIGTTDGTSILEYWLDANVSVTGSSPITGWTDLSGNGVINAINGDPVLSVGAVNGYNTVTFDGAGDFIRTSLDIAPNFFPDITIFAVYRPRIDDAGGVWGGDDNDWDRFLIDAGATFAPANNCVSQGTGPITGIPNIFPVGAYVITTVLFEEDVVNGSRVYANGNLESTFSANHGPETHNNLEIAQIGSSATISAFDFDGSISEVIIFSASLNEAERIITENYLSAKYNIALSANDVYNKDDPAHGNYDHDVAGIGRTDASNVHNDAQGTGIVRILNPGDLGDDEFLLWGHDNGLLEATETIDVPLGVQARLDRVWRVSEANSSGTAVEVGDIDIRLDLTGIGSITATDLRLIVDTDNDGAFFDETPIGGATNLGGDVYQFAGVTAIANDLRFTLGTINMFQTPLPVALVHLTATPINNKYVVLDWQTASEQNNDFFTIERSKTSIEWKPIKKVDGAGNSSIVLSYSEADLNPYPGISYYRLRQTDFDGQFEYSHVIVVHIDGLTGSQIQVYPNPTENQVNIVGNETGLSQMKIYNALGQDVTAQTEKVSINESKLVLDLSNLNRGMYYMKTKTTVNKVYKQ